MAHFGPVLFGVVQFVDIHPLEAREAVELDQLALEDVLKQSLEMTMGAVKVDEVSIWLVDETSGELFLEAERGIKEEHIHRMRLPVLRRAGSQDGRAAELRLRLSTIRRIARTGFTKDQSLRTVQE